MSINQKKKTPKIAVAFDFGTCNSAISIFEGTKNEYIDSPSDGSQTPTIAYLDPKTGKWFFGSVAILKSFNSKSDNLCMHIKRELTVRPNEKIYCGGKCTPHEVATEFLRNQKELLVNRRPDLKQYEQFGGTKLSADELALVFTIPANMGIAEQAIYTKVINAAGFVDFDGFVAEPIAAARHFAHLQRVTLNDGDRCLVIDIGGGTTDITGVTYHRGVYDQFTNASGDSYLAGLDFTNAVAIEIARELRVKWSGIYGKGGLNLSNVAAKDRPAVMGVWEAAELAKIKLSQMDDVTVPVEHPDGRKTFSIDRKKAAKLWRDLFVKFRECVKAALDNADGVEFADIAHFMLAGGTAAIPGLREEMAKAVGRDVSDIQFCPDSAHVISHGAAEHAYFQDAAAQALEPGLGFSVVNGDSGSLCHLLMAQPGQVLPADGFFVEQSGFRISTKGGISSLVVRPFVCKAGVRARVSPGRQTFLEESEIMPLQEVSVELDGVPDGVHEVTVGIHADANRILILLIRPTNLPEVETFSIHLAMSERTETIFLGNLDIVLMLDCSSSMLGEKMQKLQVGATNFCSSAVGKSAEVGVVSFPGVSSSDAGLVSPLSGNFDSLKDAIGLLTAGGSTPMAAGLELGNSSFPPRPNGATTIGVLITDGAPNCVATTKAAAEKFKQKHRLVTVGVGRDVVKQFLVKLASSPEDYFFVNKADGILDAFESIGQLIFSETDAVIKAFNEEVSEYMDSLVEDSGKGQTTPSAPIATDNGYEEDWDEMEAVNMPAN